MIEIRPTENETFTKTPFFENVEIGRKLLWFHHNYIYLSVPDNFLRNLFPTIDSWHGANPWKVRVRVDTNIYEPLIAKTIMKTSMWRQYTSKCQFNNKSLIAFPYIPCPHQVLSEYQSLISVQLVTFEICHLWRCALSEMSYRGVIRTCYVNSNRSTASSLETPYPIPVLLDCSETLLSPRTFRSAEPDIICGISGMTISEITQEYQPMI